MLTFASENEEKKAKDIVNTAVEQFGANKSSVLPSDYSVWSKYQPKERRYLERVSKWTYKPSELWKELYRKLQEESKNGTY